MRYDSRKYELWTLVASIYYFLVYLAAFIIEILLIVGLAKRGNVTLAGAGVGAFQLALDKSAKSQLALICFALAILYFIIFIASLLPIVALIMRSSLCLIIWLYLMTLLYLPEFLLTIYVSVFEWGVQSRTGQTELIFYVLRAIINVVFLFKANQLYRSWKYEKNFYKFESATVGGGARAGAVGNQFAGSGFAAGFAAAYDSPYFIGDSLSTTINPIFSNTAQQSQQHQYYASTLPRGGDYTTSGVDVYQHRYDPTSAYWSDEAAAIRAMEEAAGQPDYDLGHNGMVVQTMSSNHNHSNNSQQYDTHDRRFSSTNNNNLSRPTYTTSTVTPTTAAATAATTTTPMYAQQQQQTQDFNHSSHHHHHQHPHQDVPHYSPSSKAELDRAYSMHSLERLHQSANISDNPMIVSDQIVLRPLSHRPFDYLRRPGSTLDLSSRSQPSIDAGDQQADALHNQPMPMSRIYF